VLVADSAPPSSSPGSIFTLLRASERMGGVSVLVLGGDAGDDDPGGG